jgi:hypothetical protein
MLAIVVCGLVLESGGPAAGRTNQAPGCDPSLGS